MKIFEAKEKRMETEINKLKVQENFYLQQRFLFTNIDIDQLNACLT